MSNLAVHRSRGYLNTTGLKLVVEPGDPDEASDRDLAIQVRVALERHYPDHPWSVTFSNHNLVVRHGLIAGAIKDCTGKPHFGSLLPRGKMHTPKQVIKAAVTFGGALLEAFGLPRGRLEPGCHLRIPQDLFTALRSGAALKGWR
jgi:hypothetical protein